MKKLMFLFILVFSLFLFCCKEKEKTVTQEIKNLFEYDTIEEYEVNDDLDINGLFRLKEIAIPKDDTLNVKSYHYFDNNYKADLPYCDRELYTEISFGLENKEGKDIKDKNVLNAILNEKYKIALYGYEIIFSFNEKYYYAHTLLDYVYDKGTVLLTGIWELEKVSYKQIKVFPPKYLDIDNISYFIPYGQKDLIIFPTSIIEDGHIKIPVLSNNVFCTDDFYKLTNRIYATIQKTPYGITTYCIDLELSTDNFSCYIMIDYKYSYRNLTSEKIDERKQFLISSAYIDYNPPKDCKKPSLGITYYGAYKGGYCVYVVPNYGSIKRNYRTTTIAGYEFIYDLNLELMYIKDNKAMTLKEAYSKNLLDKNDIRLIWDVNEGDTLPPTLKPIIYLYPLEDVDLSIKFKDPSRLLTTYPKYDDGWNVHVSKDSNIIIDGRSYYGLFFDEVSNYEPDFSEGFFVTKDNAISFLEESLDKMGFTEREACEFIMFWLPVLENNEMSLVYFEQTQERNEECPLELSVDFDTYLRVIIHIKKVNEVIDIKEQVLERVNRVGSCLVEWGGSNR